MESKPKTIVFIVIAFAVVVLSVSLSRHPGQAIPVKLVKIGSGELTSSVSSVGKIKPLAESAVRAKTTGVIDDVYVKEGQFVAKGMTVLSILSDSGEIFVKSPVSGRVIELPKTTETGAPVLPGQELITVADMFSMIAETDVNETDFNTLKTGQRAYISNDAFPSIKFNGFVESVAPYIHDTDGASKIAVKVRLLSASGLIPGNKVDIEIVTANKTNAVYVPLETIASRGNGKYVYTAQGDTAKEVPVATGISNLNYVEIVPGKKLSSNEMIIVSSDRSLKDGSKISVTDKE